MDVTRVTEVAVVAWSTVGVSGNIIDASFQALVDAIAYRLLKVRVAAQ